MKKISIALLLLLTVACSSSEETNSEEESIENNVAITSEGTTPVSSIPETTAMTLSEEVAELIKSLPVVKFEDCTEEELKVGDEYPLVIYIGSSTADIKEVFIQIDDEASGMSEYSFSGEDVPKKDQVRTYSLNLEMLDYESEYTIFITAYAVDVEDNQDGKVCSIIVEKSDTSELETEFLDYFLENEIKGYINLTEAEIQKTYALQTKFPSLFFWNEYTCYKNDEGMTQTALLDEFFPVYYENKYYFDQNFVTEDSDGKEYVFQLRDGYKCKLTYDNSENPEYISLYGRPFYQNDKWWIFEEKESEPIPVATPGYYSNWATRVELNDFEKVYKEWVSDAIPPDIVFSNCPEAPIDVKVYNLKWGILSGNADIDYLRIALWKNGEYYSRVYFEKENHSDIFSFPVANTETYYEQPVTRPNEEGEIIMEVFFAIDDEYGNATEKSCVITFKES